tara:strand:+ start:2823 stop:4079 length:1257 start_codon:yes stop_codon:yes gene_type:complete
MILQIFFAFSLIYFLFRNQIDFLLLCFLAASLYSWQIIYGTIWVPPYIFEASYQSKIIILIVLVNILAFTFLNDLILKDKKNKPYDREKENDELNFYLILMYISYFACLVTVANTGVELFSLGKKEIVSASGLPFFFLIYYPAGMACLFFVTSKRYKHAFFAFLPLLFYVFIGFRAAAVITFITGFFIYYHNQKIFNLQLYKPILILASIFSFFVIYKFSYIGLKLGDLSLLAEIIEKDPRFSNYLEFLAYAYFSAEFGQAASNLSISASLDLNEEFSFRNSFFGSIPFIDFITGIGEEESRFSTVIEKHANPGFSYGLGSSIWGEFYQAGGYGAVGIFSILVSFVIFQFNLAFMRSKERFTIFAFYIGFLAFYIHRNDFVLVVGHLKNIIFLTLIGVIALWTIKNKISLHPFSKSKT